jgi:hypothetical protein
MAAERIEKELEEERAYWQARLATLEMLLCELIAKNERLRQEKEIATATKGDAGDVPQIS